MWNYYIKYSYMCKEKIVLDIKPLCKPKIVLDIKRKIQMSHRQMRPYMLNGDRQLSREEMMIQPWKATGNVFHDETFIYKDDNGVIHKLAKHIYNHHDGFWITNPLYK